MMKKFTDSLSYVNIRCPNCKKKGCGFCNRKGTVAVLPGENAYEYLQIALMKYRINNSY